MKKNIKTITIVVIFLGVFISKPDMSFFDKFIISSVLSLLISQTIDLILSNSSSNSNSFSSFGWGNNVSNNQQTVSSEKKKYNGDKSILFKNNKQNNHSKPKSTVIVNGKKYKVEGNNISVQNGKIYVDGKLINKKEAKANNIIIEGNVENIETDLSVSCNNVKGDIKAGGSINCDNVGGNITASGSVNCDRVNGDINAKGSVNSI